MKAVYTTGPRGPAIETPSCPALGFVLSQDGNRPDAWFLTTLAEALRAVLVGEVPDWSVAQDEVSADVTPERVEIVVSDTPAGPLFRESLPTQECSAVVARWQAHLKSLSQQRQAESAAAPDPVI